MCQRMHKSHSLVDCHCHNELLLSSHTGTVAEETSQAKKKKKNQNLNINHTFEDSTSSESVLNVT